MLHKVWNGKEEASYWFSTSFVKFQFEHTDGYEMMHED